MGGYTTEPKGQLLDYWDDIPFIYAGSISHPEAVLKKGTNKKFHPAQMPINLIKRAILFSTDEGDTVLEPFMGLAAGAVACSQTKRDYIGFEQNSDYVDAANARLAKSQLQYRIEFQ